MALRISGKNMDIGDSLRGQIEDRLEQAVGKYFDGGFSGHVTVEREGPGFRTDCAVHLDTGVVLQAEGSSQDAHKSFEAAAERVEKRLRRYKRRLKEHHHGRRDGSAPATSYVIATPDEDAEVAPDYSPVIIAEEATDLPTMTVGNAVLEMDLSEVAAVVFRNAGHGGINFVYRRRDGNIGWIDPSLTGGSEGADK
jgi:ribosomal subunit interface protein